MAGKLGWAGLAFVAAAVVLATQPGLSALGALALWLGLALLVAALVAWVRERRAARDADGRRVD